MNVLLLSDSHGFHRQIVVPENIDVVIHCGDASNAKDPARNSVEMSDFFQWYQDLPVKHKLYSPGNHDVSVERGMFRDKDLAGIQLLIHESVTIEGVKIFCSPYTPTFGDWAFMKAREKINRCWETIPADTDILITHGPPKGILDISEDRDYNINYCGDSALLKVVERIAPKYHCFGHIHDFKNHRNNGTRTLGDLRTVFINATMVEDGRFDKGLIHQGRVIEI